MESSIGYSDQSTKTKKDLFDNSRHVIINNNKIQKSFIHHLTQTPPLEKFESFFDEYWQAGCSP